MPFLDTDFATFLKEDLSSPEDLDLLEIINFANSKEISENGDEENIELAYDKYMFASIHENSQIYNLADYDTALRSSQDLIGYIFQDSMSKRGNFDLLAGNIRDYMGKKVTNLQRFSDYLDLRPFGHGINKSYISYFDYHFSNSPHVQYSKILYRIFLAHLEDNIFSTVAFTGEEDDSAKQLEKGLSCKYHTIAPQFKRSYVEHLIEEYKATYHILDVIIDEDFFGDEDENKNDFSQLVNSHKNFSVLLNSTFYSSFLQSLNEFMYMVYLIDAKDNRKIELSLRELSYLDKSTGAFSMSKTLIIDGDSISIADLIEDLFGELNFYKNNAFSEWWYDDLFAYFERLNKVFYEG
jgi:hypothetical protein